MNIPYYNPELTRESALVSPHLEHLADVAAVLKEENLRSMAERGELTFGMIRPNLEDAVIGADGKTDQELADEIESKIQNLAIVVKFSVVIDNEAINEFYDGPPKYESMLPKPAINPRFPNRWEEFAHAMTSAPTTVLLMQAENNAVEAWRDQLGHWNIEAYRNPETIRGRYAKDNNNNLVHGSDSPESVIRETAILSGMIDRRLRS